MREHLQEIGRHSTLPVPGLCLAPESKQPELNSILGTSSNKRFLQADLCSTDLLRSLPRVQWSKQWPETFFVVTDGIHLLASVYPAEEFQVSPPEFYVDSKPTHDLFEMFRGDRFHDPRGRTHDDTPCRYLCMGRDEACGSDDGIGIDCHP